MGNLCMVLVKVDYFIFPTNFVNFDSEVVFDILIILERSFLSIGRALVDMHIGNIKCNLNDKQVTFNVGYSIRQPKEMFLVSMIDTTEDDVGSVPIEERLSIVLLTKMIINFDSDDIREYDKMVGSFTRKGSYTYMLKKLDLNLKNRATLLSRPYIKEPSILEL